MLEPLLLRPIEAAKLLGLSRSTVYEMIAAGELPSVRLGHSIRVPLAALKDWIEERTVVATTCDFPIADDRRRLTGSH
jgi:excisionase family DNA binding protein